MTKFYPTNLIDLMINNTITIIIFVVVSLMNAGCSSEITDNLLPFKT